VSEPLSSTYFEENSKLARLFNILDEIEGFNPRKSQVRSKDEKKSRKHAQRKLEPFPTLSPLDVDEGRIFNLSLPIMVTADFEVHTLFIVKLADLIDLFAGQSY
jgi:hypothetical protein